MFNKTTCIKYKEDLKQEILGYFNQMLIDIERAIDFNSQHLKLSRQIKAMCYKLYGGYEIQMINQYRCIIVLLNNIDKT